MHLSNILPLALATLTIATPHIPRQAITASTLIADIHGIDTGVNALKADLSAYNGGLLGQTPFVADFLAITVANRKGYADALLASNFSAADSTSIVQYTIDSVGNDIPASVDVLKSKKPLFEAQGEDQLISAQLALLLYEHDSFSAALEQKLTADLAAGSAVVKKIHDAIEGGIQAFMS